jgi:hypothetical protein
LLLRESRLPIGYAVVSGEVAFATILGYEDKNRAGSQKVRVNLMRAGKYSSKRLGLPLYGIRRTAATRSAYGFVGIPSRHIGL